MASCFAVEAHSAVAGCGFGRHSARGDAGRVQRTRRFRVGGVRMAGSGSDSRRLSERLDVPVYSAATRMPNGDPNFNLITFASPASLGQDCRFMVGFYKGTASWENVKRDRLFALQLLSTTQAPLWRVLGKASSLDPNVNKLERLRDHGVSLVQCQVHDGDKDLKISVMQNSVGYAKLKAVQWVDCDDHDWAVCDNLGWCTLSGDNTTLTTGLLREKHGL